MITGVVLAAGASRRMGEPKPLLEVEGETFLERAVHTLRDGGCGYVIAVVNDAADWTQRLADVAGAAVVVNPDPLSEQIDSLRLALAHVPADTAAVVVLPVDVPRVSPATVRALCDAFGEHAAAIVLPEYRGATGHPVLLPARVFEELRGGRLDEGVRSLLAARADELRRVPVDDPGVLIDIDTPDDYRAHIDPA